MSALVPPHGGVLKPLLLTGEALAAERQRAAELPQLRMSSRETSDLIMLATGAFSPLDGFMRQADYQRVVSDLYLADGTMWPIPITLSTTTEAAAGLSVGTDVALIDDESGELMGTMIVEEKYTYDKQKEAREVFKTTELEHPGVAKVMDQGEVLLGGPVKALSEGHYPEQYGEYYARPAETRAIFEERGWRTVAGFQTRNPIHRSHEYCTKIALEICDGLLIHPLVGKLKAGDIPAEVRMECYEVLMENYYPSDRVVCRVYPMEMRYGGPREALLHAVFRQNYGCSHLIVGRDHAGVGSYYGPFDAQDIFTQLQPGDLYLKPMNIDWTFFCYKCGNMASNKTCPHAQEDRLFISGTKLREMLAAGEYPPTEFSRREVLEILVRYYAEK